MKVALYARYSSASQRDASVADQFRVCRVMPRSTSGDGELKIDGRGDLAGILAVAPKTKTPATRAGVSQFEMVAGT